MHLSGKLQDPTGATLPLVGPLRVAHVDLELTVHCTNVVAQRHQNDRHDRHDDNDLTIQPSAHLHFRYYTAPTMSSEKHDVPSWVAQLESPPPAKTKLPGIQDPPGYGSGSAVTQSKVSTFPSTPLVSLQSLTRHVEEQRHQSPATQAPDRRGDGNSEAQEGMGGRLGSRQRSTHDWHHDVHVRKLAADLQHHDGIHGIQESFDGLDEHDPGV